MSVEDEAFDANAELLESAAEALTIIAADDGLKAAWDEVVKAKREARAATALYDSVGREIALHKRNAARWEALAKKSALCSACRVNLERDDDDE